MTNPIYASEKVLPYVYMGVHKTTGQFYIGYRANVNAQRLPSHLDLGTKYFTSSKLVKDLGFENFDWFIIAEFLDWESGCSDAYFLEQQLIIENWNNPLKLNKKHQLSGKFSRAGLKNDVEHNEKISSSFSRKSEEEQTIIRYKLSEAWNKRSAEENARIVAKRRETISNKTDDELALISKKISSTLTGRKRSKKACESISKGRKGIIFSEEHKQNLARNVSTCPHCGKTGKTGSMHRWHFEKCALRAPI